MRDEVLQQVGAPVLGLDRPVVGALHQHPVLLVPEGDPAPGSVDHDKRLTRPLGAERHGRGERGAARRADPYTGGVVGLDVVGAVELQLDTGEVLGAAAAVDGQGGGDGVRERVGENSVDDVGAVHPPFSCPGGAGEVGGVPYPGAGRADAAHLADGPLGDELADRGQGVRAEGLEADLTDGARGTYCLGDPLVLGVGGGRGLLQQEVHPACGGGQRQLGVGGNGRADDGDTGPGGLEQRIEVRRLLRRT
jgi:hypothetical protein